MDRRWVRMALAALALLALLALPVGAAARGKKKKKVKPPPPVVTATATASTSTDGELVSPTATCPPGTISLGGGFSSEVGREEGVPTDLLVVYESRRDSPTSWHVAAAREDSGDPGNTTSITVTVFCQSPNLGTVKKPKKKKKKKRAAAANMGKKHRKHKKPKKRTLLISEVSSAGPAADQAERSSATASCPAGLNVLSGGFSITPPPTLGGGGLSFPFIWANHATPANAWTATETTSGTEPMTLTSYAYCANTPPPLALTGSGTVAATQTGSATTPACPADRPVIGGGFDNAPVTAGGSTELAFESTGSGSGGWTTSAYDVASGAPASLQAIAYCR